MKSFIQIITFMLAMGTSAITAQGVQLGTLHVIVEGIKNPQGQVKVALEKSPDEFNKGPLHQAHYRGESITIKGDKVEVYFRDVPFGTYAIKTFHDADGNGTLNTNFMGIPSEDYGFSNNVRGTMGPASFQDARFDLNNAETTLTIRLK